MPDLMIDTYPQPGSPIEGQNLAPGEAFRHQLQDYLVQGDGSAAAMKAPWNPLAGGMASIIGVTVEKLASPRFGPAD